MIKMLSIPFVFLSLIYCLNYIVGCLLEIKVLDIFGFSVTGGFFLIPVAYIINDCIVEVYGYKKAKAVMWLTFAANTSIVIIFQLACWAPPAPYWNGNEHFTYIFGQSPRIAIAAILAFIFATNTNAIIMSKMKVSCPKLGFKARAMVSTIFGETVDAVIFFPIVFYGILTNKEIIVMIISTTIGKCAYEALILPITTKVVSYIKHIDNTDVYDTDVSYKLLSFK